MRRRPDRAKLGRTAREPEMLRACQNVAVAGPYFTLAQVHGGGQMHRIANSQMDGCGKRHQQKGHLSQETFSDGNKGPDPVVHVLQKSVEQRAILRRIERSLAQIAVKRTGNFSEGPHRRDQCRGTRECGPNLWRVRLVQVEFGDISRIDVHQRSRSSEINRVLSPGTWGNSFQKRLMSGIFTFLGFFVTGRSSATGWPRRSMTITSPFSASRSNSEVRMRRSRTEAFLICYIVAHW